MSFATSTLPRITIVTPCLNGAPYIVDAIESVLRQNYPNCEHIVVDGGSTDGTLALLRQYPHLTVIEGRDRGSHDAMNVGIARARGELIGFLNADDVYPPLTFHRAARALRDDADVVVGDSLVFEEMDGDRQAVRFIFRHARGVWLPECLFGNPALNGCFFRRSVFDTVGLFNNDFTITADRDFFVRMALAGVRSVALNHPTIWYRAHSRSQTINRKRANIGQIADELFAMASHRASHTLGANQQEVLSRRTIKVWRAFEGARLIFVQLRGRDLRNALRLLLRGHLLHPLWPLQLVHAGMLRRLARRDYRGGWNADLSAELSDQIAVHALGQGRGLASAALGLSEHSG